MKRALVVVAGWLLLISGLFSTVTAADLAAQDTLTLYLLGNGVSWADLGTDPPPARPLPNHDASRNTDPGLTISRGGSGFDEWGWDMYQAWYSTSGGFDLNGEARLYLWSAVRDFLPVKGSITAYLMVCNGGGSCEHIATVRRDIDPWSHGDWEEQVFSFGTVAASIASNQRIADQADREPCLERRHVARIRHVNVRQPPRHHPRRANNDHNDHDDNHPAADDHHDNHPAAHHDHIDAPADVDHNDHLRARSHDHDPAPDDNHAATADHHCTARDDDHAGARFGSAGTTASAQRHNSASDSS